MTKAVLKPVSPPSHATGRRRHTRLPRFAHLDGSIDASETLAALRAGLVGCGAVGRCIALGLARLQPARILLVDGGRYRASNLQTQPIGSADVGRRKAGSTGRAVTDIDPAIDVRVFDGPVEALGGDAFCDCDVVFLASDNIAAEIDVSQRCVAHQVPLIQAAVCGEVLVSQVRLLRNRDGDGPCLACGFGEGEWRHLSRQTRWSCGGGGGPLRAMPTMSVASLCSMAADMAVLLSLRLVLGLGAPLQDVLVEYCGYTQDSVTSLLRRRPDCPAEHVPWERRPITERLDRMTLREVIEAADMTAALAGGALSLMVDDLVFVASAACRCSNAMPVGRFAAPRRSVGSCATCGRSLVPTTFGCHRRAPLALVKPVLDRPLHELGAAGSRFAVLRDGRRSVYVHSEPAMEMS